MISIKVEKDNNKIKMINIKGHANYAEKGKDIVCSAVSSIVITTINGILSIDENSIDYIDNSNNIKITVIKDDLITNKLILNMLNLLKELEEDYPNNIKFI
jgi:hypothetical protein